MENIKNKCIELSKDLLLEMDKIPQSDAQALAEWAAQHWQRVCTGAMAYARATPDGRKAVKAAMEAHDRVLKQKGVK